MRHEELYLRDILEAAEHISRFIAESGRSGFDQSELVRSAVVQKLAVIGEAAARISIDLKASNADVPWSRIAAFRNILVHAYFGIDWDVMWRAAEKQVPVLRDQVQAILDREFGPT
jgi:uncharacterized protein with HEPN domain